MSITSLVLGIIAWIHPCVFCVGVGVPPALSISLSPAAVTMSPFRFQTRKIFNRKKNAVLFFLIRGQQKTQLGQENCPTKGRSWRGGITITGMYTPICWGEQGKGGGTHWTPLLYSSLPSKARLQ